MAESLFSRLQKLSKEATPGPWVAHKDGGIGHDDCGGCVAALQSPLFENSELIVECRNSLPAVLNLIEAARKADLELWARDAGMAELTDALDVFVTPEGDRSTMSGQEDERRSP